MKYKMICLIATVTALCLFAYQNCGDPYKSALTLNENSGSETPTVANNPVSLDCSIDSVAPASSLDATCLGYLGQMPTEGYSNLRTYTPQYPLYSDGAEKQRWVYLPEDSQIDTSDPDEWVYPEGTILWKQFVVNGKKVETRQMEKISPGTGSSAWRSNIYVWRADQSQADLMDSGFTLDNTYEAFNIQSSYTLIDNTRCNSCHRGSVDNVQGFTYLQLSSTSLDPQSLHLQDLKDESWLTENPVNFDQIQGTSVQNEALGFMHANCASCHSPNGSASYLAMNLKHSSLSTAPEEENAYVATVNVSLQNGTGMRVQSGQHSQSSIYNRVNNLSMPPSSVGLNTYDPAGRTALRDWINSL